MSGVEYDIEALEQIPIQEVVLHLGGNYPKDREPGAMQYNMHCCNGAFHNEGDKKPSLTIWKSKNICKCHVCGIAGSPISVAKKMHGGDFKAACEWLHETFGIPYKKGISNHTKSCFKKAIPQEKKIRYQRFMKPRGFKHIEVEKYIDKYGSLEKKQRLKLVYTYLYRYSLTTDRKNLDLYHSNRGIDLKHPHYGKIGYLSSQDIEDVLNKMMKIFPVGDLVKFGIIHEPNHKFPLGWKLVKNAAIVPFFDIYTDLVEGMMLRPIDDSNKWFKGKEMRLSSPSIAKPYPFGVGYKLLSDNCDIYITEGYIDALSLPLGYCFIATPGVQAFEQEQLGILQGRNIKICFDQDEAGQKAAWGYTEVSFLNQNFVILNKEKDLKDLEATKRLLSQQKIEVKTRKVDGFIDHLKKAGVASVEILTWDSNLGKDINDLLINKKIDIIQGEKYGEKDGNKS